MTQGLVSGTEKACKQRSTCAARSCDLPCAVFANPLINMSGRTGGPQWQRIAVRPLHPHWAGELAPEPVAGSCRSRQRRWCGRILAFQGHTPIAVVCRGLSRSVAVCLVIVCLVSQCQDVLSFHALVSQSRALSAVKTKIFRVGSVVFVLVQVALQGSYRYDRSESTIRAVRRHSLAVPAVHLHACLPRCTCLSTDVQSDYMILLDTR